MIRSEPRYAIYFVPPAESELYRFGSGVIGYDCYAGKRRPVATLEEIPGLRWEAATRAPRRYGFHATLKAPFRLRAGIDENALLREIDAFAAACLSPLPVRLRIERLSGFAALVPQEASAAVDGLAAACVAHFDRFRAPLSPEERARRLAASDLSARQISYLDRHGYPYVLEEFRFHMTLTGRLPDDARDRALSALRKKFVQDVGDRTLSLSSITVVKQASPRSAFRVLYQRALAASAGAKPAPRPSVNDLQRRLRDEWT